MKKFALILILALCLFSFHAEARFFKSVTPTRHLRLPMEDGVRLATDIYLPDDGAESWPVVLIRSTYGRTVFPESLIDDGYALVIQDIRGMGGSEGEKHIFYYDGWREGKSDGAWTVDWIHDQPWCNGHAGTWGGSALGMTQVLLAPATDRIDCQVINVAPGSFYQHVLYPGGVWRENLCNGWLMAIGQPHIIPIYQNAPCYGPFWHWYDSIRKAPDITMPALFITSWYDIFQKGSIAAFQAREKAGGEGARGRNYLIIHSRPHHGDVTKDYKTPARRGDLSTGRVRNAFLSAHLKGDAEALSDIAKVNYFVMGDDTDPDAPGNEWRTAETWPPFEPVYTPWRLGGEGKRALKRGDAGDGVVAFTADPENPVPTLGGPNLFPNLPAGPFDQRVLREEREDILVFTSPLLTEPVEVIGNVAVRLFISCDTPDTDMAAKLIDVFPDGREINVLDNIQRVRFRNGYESPELLSGPDEIVKVLIDLWDTAWVFNTGHRIAIHIAGSNHPRFEVNPNTGADHPAEGEAMRKAHIRIHMDEDHDSALLLPGKP
jgi:uncharacterized protein